MNAQTEAILKQLATLGACQEASLWVLEQGTDGHTLWQTCQRGDWMVWYLWRKKLPPLAHCKEFVADFNAWVDRWKRTQHNVPLLSVHHMFGLPFVYMNYTLYELNSEGRVPPAQLAELADIVRTYIALSPTLEPVEVPRG